MTGRRVTRLRLTWQLVAAFGAVTTAAYPFLSVLAQNVAYDALGLLCVLAVGVGLFRYRPSRPAPWLLLGLGVLLWVLGDLAYSWQDLQPGDPPFPAVADLLYLGGYPAMAAGLALSVRRTGARDGAAWQDASILALAASVLVWETLLQPVVEEPGTSVVARSVALGYPVMGLVLLLLVLRLVHGRGRRPGPCGVLALALALYLVSDMAYGLQVVRGTYETGGAVDLGWLLSYAVLGTLALHPSMVYIAHPAPAGPLRRSRLRLIGLSSAALVAPCTLAQRHLVGDTDDVLPFAIASSVLFLLVSLRSSGLIVELESLTGELRGREGELERRATTDALTGLANRRVLSGRLEQDARAGRRSCVALLDLDDFKHVNDTRGHDAGDALIVEVGRRLADAVAPGDLVARLGGDEFAVVSSAGSRELGRRLQAALSTPVRVQDELLHVAASIGVTTVEPWDSQADPLRQADVAMYESKTAGGGQVIIWSPDMSARLLNRLELRGQLERAVAEEQFTAWLQPIVDLASHRLVGFEALARWERPGQAPATPDAWLAIAEQTGLIVAIDDLVLRQAARALVAWSALVPGAAALSLAVNASGHTLQVEDAAERVLRALQVEGLHPSRLVLEVTEGVLIDDEEVGSRLQRLREAGVRIALDDFGTGWSSLAYLRRFPVDVLKLDRSFVAGVGDGDGGRAVPAAVLHLAAALRLEVVAEGVETPEQADVLRQLGCRAAQGYLYARPAPPDALSDLVRRGKVAGGPVLTAVMATVGTG